MATPKQNAANRMTKILRTTHPCRKIRIPIQRPEARHLRRHQIMFDEKPEDLAELSAEYHELCGPADSKERFPVDTLVHNEWRLRRTRRVEAELWRTAYNAFIVRNIEVILTCTSGRRLRHRFRHLRAPPAGSQFLRARLAPYPQGTPTQGGAGFRLPTPTPCRRSPNRPPQPEQSKPTSGEMASFRQNPKTPHSAPAAEPFARRSVGENPAESRPL
jgi:hypothetical protein